MSRKLATLVLLAAAGSASAAGKTKVAVTDIKNVQGVQAGTATILSDIVVSEVARAGYDVVSQSDINAMIGFEKQKKVLGCVDDSSCLAEVGGALGVDYMLAGQVGQIGTRYRISLLLVDTKKARVAARSAQFCDQNEDALAKAAESTVRELVKGIPVTVGLPPAVAQPAPATPSKAAPAAGGAAVAAAAPPPQLKTPPPAPTPAAQAATSVSSTSPGPRHGGTAAWITLGAGATMVACSVGAGWVAKQRYDDLKARQNTFGYVDNFDSKASAVHSMAVTSDVLMGLGIATAGVGTWLWFRGPGPHVAVVPVVTPSQAGLVAAASF
jgi:TolB-like protein